MLTLLHPEVLPSIRNVPAGLLVLTPDGVERPVMAVKAPKEVILTARVRRRFAVYVVPVTVGQEAAIALVSAFFDVPDEPLILRSPLFAEDEHSRRLISFLLAEEADVHFFDEHTRELLAYRSHISVPEVTRARLQRGPAGQFSDGAWRGVDRQMQLWFSERTANDDREAVDIRLAAPLMPEDIFVINASGMVGNYVGAPSFTTSLLVRHEPGPMQEHDIGLLLERVFRPEQIIRGPLRVGDKEEIADILVVTDDSLIFFQAKDSPNTENILGNPLSRKKATALKSLRKAIGQLRGAIRYAKRQSALPILVDGTELLLDVAGLRWRSVAVVKELFDDEYESYSSLVLQLGDETKVPGVALDYGELTLYTAHLTTEESFIAALDRVFLFGREHGVLPRLRLGPAVGT